MLRELGITPSKALGQHFLHDRKIVRRIVDESGIAPDDAVLEIGPGLGILTQELIKRAGNVTVIERDDRLADRLIAAGIPDLRVVKADALAVDFAELMGDGPYHVVANLPYSVGTAIVQQLQESPAPPRTMTLMLQREVAERMVATPPDMHLLAVAVQFYGTPKVLFRIGTGAFVPPPNVQSAVIRITEHPEPLLPYRDHKGFFRVVRAGFSQPRKQLLNNLTHGLGIGRDEATRALSSAAIDPRSRPERLAVEDWVRLHQILSEDQPS